MQNSITGIVGKKQQLLTWFVKVTLVLGLLSFTGNVSGFSSFNPEPTKTELRIAFRLESKKAVSYKKIVGDLPVSDFPRHRRNTYTNSLRQFENKALVIFRNSVEKYIAIKKLLQAPVRGVYLSSEPKGLHTIS